MRAAAITALLAAVASAGEGVELVYEFQEGEAAAAAKVLARRLTLLGIEGGLGGAEADGRRVVLRLPSRERLEEVRAVADRVGRLEMRRVVDPRTDGYPRRRKDLDAAIARGDDPVRDVPPESLKPEERKRWPLGLRWYRNPKPSEALKEEWILCELDGWGITEASIEDVRAGDGGGVFAVTFTVKEGFRANMAELTRCEGEPRLAVILDGDVLMAPVLKAQLRDSVQITTPDDRETLVLGAVLGSGPLPSKPKFVEERAAGS